MIEKYFIKQAFKKIDLERFFEKHFAKAGFNSLSIVKTPMSTRLIVSVAKPGIAIGYSGKTIKGIGQIIEDKFGIKNPHIEIKSVEDSEYNVKYIVQGIVAELEKGINWKQVAYRAVKSLSELPIMGFELIFKGKLMSKGGRKQKYRFVSGYLKVIGDQTKFVKDIKIAANTKAGVIGIRLRLVPPNVLFPDKIGEKEIIAAVKGLNIVPNTDKDITKVVVEEVIVEKKSETKTEKPKVAVEKKAEAKTELKKEEIKKVDIVKVEKPKVVVEKKVEAKKEETKKVDIVKVEKPKVVVEKKVEAKKEVAKKE